MSFFNWARWMRSLYASRTKTYRKKSPRFAQLSPEPLEDRTLLAVPYIMSVTPANGSTVTIANPISPPPTLAVTFNEDMNNAGLGADPTDVSNVANYLMFTSNGQPVVVNSATYSNNGGAGPFVVTLTYNNGLPLSAGTYTLLVQGGELQEAAAPNLPMSQAGQLVVANQGSASVSVVGVNLANDAQLEAATNYPVHGFDPTAAVMIDDGTLRTGFASGINDLVIASYGSAGPVVNIYQGRLQGGFGATPAATLDLPPGAEPTGLALGALDTNHNGYEDIAVSERYTTANHPGEVDVFITTTGNLTYAPYVSYPGAGQNPIAIVAADIDGDGKLDLTVADAGQDAMGKYDVNVLLGTGAGTFAAGVATDTTATGPLTGLASFGTFGKPDLVVSSDSGTYLLKNTSKPGTVTLTPALLPGSSASSAVAIGDINEDFFPDIVAVTFGGDLQAWTGPLFAGPPTILNPGNPIFSDGGAIAITDLIDGPFGDVNDIVVTDGFDGNTMQVLLQNASAPGTFAPPVTYTTGDTPVALAVGDTGGDDAADGGASDVVTINEDSSDFTVFRQAVTGGFPDGSFWTSTDYPTSGGSPNAVATGDLTSEVPGDGGLPDIVVADKATDSVEVFLATGVDPHGLITYGPSNVYFLPVGSQPVSVALGDFDPASNDGLDIAVADQGSTATITAASWVAGMATITAANTFVPGEQVTVTGMTPAGYNGTYTVVNSTGANFTYALATDPGVGTAFGAAVGGNGVSILLNDGTGNFTVEPTIPVGALPTQLVVADFNNDGNLDIAVAHDGPNPGVQLLLGNGDGTFRAPLEIAPGLQATALAAADFNNNGNTDLVVASSPSATSGQITVLMGNGIGGFSTAGTYAVSADPDTIAIADLNRDGFPDIVVGSTSATTTANGNLNVLLNVAGNGFTPAIPVSLFAGAEVQSVAVTDLSDDAFPDLVVALSTADGQANNVYALAGNGDGTFQAPMPYFADGVGAAPSAVAVSSDPLILATSFIVVTSNVTTNLIRNGSFATPDLNGDAGSLTGWETYSQANSGGAWEVQTPNVDVGYSTSPLSQTNVPAPPTGLYAAMLDQANTAQSLVNNTLNEFFTGYAGTNVLYQDITIPANNPLEATTAILSFSLYYDSVAAFSDPTVTPALDYTSAVPDQQIRVDIVDPTAPAAANPLDVGSSVLENLFITTPTTSSTQPYTQMSFDLSAFAGQTIRLRFAETNNQAPLIIGLDNVRLDTTFIDSSKPTLSNVALRNPGYGAAPGSAGATSDPTIIGTVNDLGTSNNIAYITAVATNTVTGAVTTANITNWDALGNFSLTLPITVPDTYNVSIQATNRTGLVTAAPLTFTLLGASVGSWEAVGPGPIATTAVDGVNYPTVSGDITAIAVDPEDSSGDTFYVGTANGGVWKTTDGGADYTPLTDYVTNAGNPVNTPIGGLALDPSNPEIIYAGTGVADGNTDSSPGDGILKSVNGGLTWTVVGAAVFTGAEISKVLVVGASAANPEIVYVAVVAGGSGPGLYRSEDGGATWINVLNPATNMFTAPNPPGAVLGAAVSLGSVTDVEISPYDPETVYVGIGNIGLLADSASAGVWKSPNAGTSWQQLSTSVDGIANGDLPSGLTVGRVTIGLGTGSAADGAYVYVLMSNAPAPYPPPTTGPNTLDSGTFMGLYASRNSGADWTHVLLEQPTPPVAGPPPPLTYSPITLVNNDGGYAGAVTVDPTDPYVVYLGGSRNLAPSNVLGGADQLMHSLIRVDTTGMIDAETHVINDKTGVNLGILNTGDDYEIAEQDLYFNGGNFPNGDPYTPVGMPWTDLIDNTSNTYDPGSQLATTILNRMPTTINVLVIDPQGRLLIGTDGGIWRSNSVGFGSALPVDNGDASGLNRKTLPTVETGLTLTDLNGNLQIADLNSVAIDPTNPNTYYTSESGTGLSMTTGSLDWQSMGLESDNQISPGILLQEFGGTVVAGPGAAPGAATQVYSTWEYADFSNGIGVQASANGGAFGSFAPINNGFIIPADQGSLVLPLAINPVQDVPGENEVLFGTDRIYLSDDDGSTWRLFPTVLTAAEGTTTALAFAPSGDDSMYVGTSTGHVLVDLNDGPSFLDVTNNLPGNGAVNGITVYPGDLTHTTVVINGTTYQREDVAYAMLNGPAGTGHVWQTLNGGASWTDVSTGLPNVPAYSMVIDDRPGLGAPDGTMYVGTEDGVYYSTNNGTSWSRYGQGLPNVPVVDLQYDTATNTLVAGTRGRGVFTANTAAISAIPNQVISENTPSAAIPFTVSNGSGSYTLTATSNNKASITAASWVPDVATITAANTFTAGQQVTIAGMTPAAYNGTFTILSANSTSFTYALNTNPGGVGTVFGSATVSGQNLIPNANIVLGGSGANRTIQVTPALNAYSTGAGFDSAAITAAAWALGTATIQAANTFTPGEQVTIAGVTPTGYNGTFTIVTADSSSFTYALVTNPGVPGGAGTATGFVGNYQGPAPATITVTVTSSTGYTASQQFNVTVDYDSPTISPIANQTVQMSASSAPLPFSVGDVETPAGALTVTASVVSSSNPALFPNPAAEFSLGGSAPITATAWATGMATIQAANSFTVGQQVVIAGVTPAGYNGAYTIKTATGSGFTYLLAANPGGRGTAFGTATAANRTLTITPAASETGTAVIELLVADGHGAISTSIVNVLVTQPVAITPPFTDSFNRSSPVFLGPGWNVNLGVFTDNGAQATAAVNLTGNTTAGKNTVVFATSISQLAVGMTVSGPGIPAGAVISTINSAASTITLSTTATATATAVPLTFGAAVNIASLNGVTAPDVSLQEDVNVGAGQSAGLIARYGGVGDKNYYLAQIVSVGTGFQAQLVKNINGVVTVLASSTLQNTAAITAAYWFDYTATIQAVNTFTPGQQVTITGMTPAAFNGTFTILTATSTAFTYALNTNPGGAATAGGLATVPSLSGTLRFDVVGSSLKLYFAANAASLLALPSPVLYVNDTSLTAAGAAGIRATNGLSVGNFSAASLTPSPLPTLPFSDDFSSPGLNSQLNTNWVAATGNFTDTGTAAVGAAAVNLATLDGLATANVTVQASVSLSANQSAALVARYQGPTNSNYYAARLTLVNGQLQASIYKGAVLIGTSLGAFANPGGLLSLTFQADGSSLKFFVNGNLEAYAVDASFASGSVGIYSSAGVSLIGFQATAINAGTGLPFTDPFAAGTLGSQLNPTNWVESAGNFNISTGNAVSKAAGVNVASVLLTTPATDVTVQATVSLAALNQSAGLIARATAATNTYYVGRLTQTSATPPTVQAAIYKYTNGVAALVGAVQTWSAATIPTGVFTIGAGQDLVFQVEGASLKLFLITNSGATTTLIAYGRDTSLTSGSVGMYASGAGVTIDSGFTASPLVSGTSLPFSDPFTANVTPANQLATANWVEQSGNFNISTGNAVPQAAGLNVASVQLTAPAITAASWSAGTVTITAANAFVAGQPVLISGVTPTGYDGIFTVENPTATGFSYALPVNPGEPGGTAAITKATWAGNIATITAANAFTAGEVVNISGMSPNGYNGAAITIASATSTAFTFALTTNPGTATGFGTATLTSPTIGAATTTDVGVEANVTLAAVGQAAGLIARDSAATNSYYVGRITQTSATTVQAAIYKYVNGVGTPIGVPLTIPPGLIAGTPIALTFDVEGSSLKLFVNNNLAAYAQDAGLTSGSVGIYTSGTANGAAIDSGFSASAITSGATLQFTDTFSSPSPGNQLNTANWVETAGNFNLLSTNAVGKAAGLNVALAQLTAPATDVSVAADVSLSALNQVAGLVARSSAAGTSYYVGRITQTSTTAVTAAIFKYTNGVGTQLGAAVTITGVDMSTVITPTSVPLVFDVEGPSLKLFVNGNLAAYAQDTTAAEFTSGSVGMYTIGKASIGTDSTGFSAAPITSGQSLPFADTFSSPSPGNQLNTANWVETAGNFNLSTSNAVGKAAGLNVALAQLTAPATDVSVAADVSLSALNQVAGLVARSSAAGTSYYVGRITQTSTTAVTAAIFKYTNGVGTQLGAAVTITGVDMSTVITPTSVPLVFDVEGPSLKLFVSGNLAAYAQDTTAAEFTSGSVGMYTIGKASIGTDSTGFSAAPITSGQSLPFADTFSSPSPGNQLNTANWVETAGNFNLSTSNAVGKAAGLNVALAQLTAPATDVIVQANVTLSAIGQAAGLVARASAVGTSYYVGRIARTSATAVVATVFKYTNGVATQLGAALTITTGVNMITSSPTLVFQVEGDSLKLFVNGTLAAYAQDTSATAFTSGSVGMYTSGAAAIDNSNGGFTATAITENSNSSPPFSDALNNTTNNPAFPTQLNNADWIEQAGNFTLNATEALGQSTVNLATVISLIDAAPTLQANITLSAVNQSAGLVASYSGPGSANMYVGAIQQVSGGNIELTISKYTNGILTTLATQMFSGNGSGGALQFTVSGGDLTLTLGADVLNVIDLSPLTATGVVGIRSSAGAAIANFSAN